MSKFPKTDPARPSVTHHDNTESVGTGPTDPETDDDDPDPNGDWTADDWEKFDERN